MIIMFENEYIKIYDTRQNYDFRYVIQNKKNNDLNIYLNGLDDYVEIEKNNWVGLFGGDYTDDIIRCLLECNGDYNEIMGGN